MKYSPKCGNHSSIFRCKDVEIVPKIARVTFSSKYLNVVGGGVGRNINLSMTVNL